MQDSAGQPPVQAAMLAAELRTLVGKLKRRLREQANSGDLTPSQISVLLRLENYALLVGSCASFAAIAATMYFTRNIDWYSPGGNYAPTPAGCQPTPRESWLR